MTMFPGVNRIIFDLDNTLIKHDSDNEFEKIAKYMRISNVEEFKRQVSHMFASNEKYIVNKRITKSFFAHVIEDLMPILRQHRKRGTDFLDALENAKISTLMEGTEELLEYLTESGYELVVLTNWFYDYQTAVMRRLGILKYFERVYGWDDHYAKPNNFALSRALSHTDKSRNLMIGDNAHSDVMLAKRNGVSVIGFNVNYDKYPNVEKADVDIYDLRDIKKYL